MSRFYNRERFSLISICRMSSAPRNAPSREHFFYTGLALVYAVTVFVGFSRTYYLKPVFVTPHLSLPFHLHGIEFTAWTLFFVYQTALIAAGKPSVHRRIGWIGAGFAACIALFGALLTIHAVRIGSAAGRQQMPDLLISGLMDVVLFSLLFALGVKMRGRPEIHKRLMMLAMLCAIIPAIARLPVPAGMVGWAIFAFSLAGLIYDAISTRRVYLSNVTGALLINGCAVLHFYVEETRAWQHFTAWVAH